MSEDHRGLPRKERGANALTAEDRCGTLRRWHEAAKSQDSRVILWLAKATMKDLQMTLKRWGMAFDLLVEVEGEEQFIRDLND